MKRKTFVIIGVLLAVELLYACADNNSGTDIDMELPVSEQDKKETTNSEDIYAGYNNESQLEQELQSNYSPQKWKNSYKEIILNAQENLVDPYNLRTTMGDYIYIGLHDFNADDIPELILGDNISIAIFTVNNDMVEKIADLFEPEEWGGINGVYFGNNNVILESNGADGSGYVCFSYRDEEYLVGICDDYNLESGKINGKDVSKEEFNCYFDIPKLLGDSVRVNYAQITIENQEVVSLKINGEETVIDNFDYVGMYW